MKFLNFLVTRNIMNQVCDEFMINRFGMSVFKHSNLILSFLHSSSILQIVQQLNFVPKVPRFMWVELGKNLATRSAVVYFQWSVWRSIWGSMLLVLFCVEKQHTFGWNESWYHTMQDIYHNQCLSGCVSGLSLIT
jgi:hypothetical protein